MASGRKKNYFYMEEKESSIIIIMPTASMHYPIAIKNMQSNCEPILE